MTPLSSNPCHLVIGCKGLIGSASSNYLSSCGYTLVGLDIGDQPEELSFLQEYYSFNLSDVSSFDDILSRITTKYQIKSVIISSYVKPKNWASKSSSEPKFDDESYFINWNLTVYCEFLRVFERYHNYDCSIVFLSSIHGISAPRFEHYDDTDMTSPLSYTVAKHGLTGLIKWYSKHMFGRSIRINAIASGGILAGQPVVFQERYRQSCNSKGLLDAIDIAHTIEFLVSSRSKYITGQTIVVDDGWSL